MDTNENNKSKFKNKIAVIIAIIVIVIVGVIAFKCELFKSKGQKFVELLTVDQNTTEIISDRTKIFTEKGEKNLTITLNNSFLSLIDSTFGLIGGDLVLSANTVKTGENYDISANLKMSDIEIQSLEVVKNGDTVALSVPNLFENYISVNNENVEEVAEKLGFVSGDYFNQNEVNEKALRLIKKYGKILAESINNYVEVDEVELDINGEILKTKRHSLIIGEKELAVIEVALFEELKDDDEAIEFIVECVKNNENISNSVKNEYFPEVLKQDITNLYTQALDTVETITGGSQILEIVAYENKGKTVKTILNIQGMDTSYEISYVAISDGESDYAVLTFDITDMILNLEYSGKLVGENYQGEIVISTDGASVPLMNLNVVKVQNSDKKVRNIEELSALLLNEATDEEIENLRNEIESNLGFDDLYQDNTIYEEGEFKLENPETQVKVLETSKELYNKINLNMTKDEVISILGEPDETFGTESNEYAGWFYEGSETIYLVSVSMVDGKVSGVYNDITSSVEDNVQISTELGTEIADLLGIVENVKVDMSKDEVINLLGDKYLEIYKDVEGYIALKWYDKNENVLVIEFDETGKVYYVNSVSTDM